LCEKGFWGEGVDVAVREGAGSQLDVGFWKEVRLFGGTFPYWETLDWIKHWRFIRQEQRRETDDDGMTTDYMPLRKREVVLVKRKDGLYFATTSLMISRADRIACSKDWKAAKSE